MESAKVSDSISREYRGSSAVFHQHQELLTLCVGPGLQEPTDVEESTPVAWPTEVMCPRIAADSRWRIMRHLLEKTAVRRQRWKMSEKDLRIVKIQFKQAENIYPVNFPRILMDSQKIPGVILKTDLKVFIWKPLCPRKESNFDFLESTNAGGHQIDEGKRDV